MAVVKELIKNTDDGLCFGDYTLDTKTKLEDYNVSGNLYKVKTFKELTKLEKDGMFVYESEPGTSVASYKMSDNGVSFVVSGNDDAMITVGLKEDTEYNVTVSDKNIGKIKTGVSGKLSFSVGLEGKGEVAVKIEQ